MSTWIFLPRIRDLTNMNWHVQINHTWREGNKYWIVNYSLKLNSFDLHVLETPSMSPVLRHFWHLHASKNIIKVIWQQNGPKCTFNTSILRFNSKVLLTPCTFFKKKIVRCQNFTLKMNKWVQIQTSILHIIMFLDYQMSTIH
jgi:hypothetical protein